MVSILSDNDLQHLSVEQAMIDFGRLHFLTTLISQLQGQAVSGIDQEDRRG
jgi:hypothetical protein